MTKEERATNWFRNVPDSEAIDMETKMDICGKAARKTGLVFFAVLALEGALLFFMGGGKILDAIAGFLNGVSGSYKSNALAGGLLCLPLVLLPAGVAVTFKNKWIKSEAARVTARGKR